MFICLLYALRLWANYISTTNLSQKTTSLILSIQLLYQGMEPINYANQKAIITLNDELLMDSYQIQ